MGPKASGITLAIESGAAAIALNVHFQDGGVMNGAVDGGERHGLTANDHRMPQSLTGCGLRRPGIQPEAALPW